MLCAATPEPATSPAAPAAPAPTPAPPASTQPAPAPEQPAPLATEQVAANQVMAVLGLMVDATGAKEIGRIVDVLVDAGGHPRAAVIDVGGFLGVGNRKVAVEWAALRFTLGKTPSVALALPADRIKSAPAYDAAKPVEAVEAPAPSVPPPAVKAPAPPVPPPAVKAPAPPVPPPAAAAKAQ